MAPFSPPARSSSDASLLLQVTSAANRSSGIEQVAAKSLEVIASVFPFDLAFFLLVDAGQHRLRLIQPVRLPPELVAAFESLSLPPDFYATVQDNRYGSYSLAHLFDGIRRIWPAADYTQPLILPLMADHRGMGVLALARCSGAVDNLYQEHFAHKDFLDAIGTQLGLAIQREWLSEQLRDSEDRHRRFIEQSRDGFMEITPDGRVTIINQAALDLLECSEPPASAFSLQTIEREEERLERWERLKRDGFLRNERVTIRTSSGSPRVLNETLWLITDPDGQVSHVQMVLRDVTARARLEDELQARNKELRAVSQISLELSRPLQAVGSLDEVCEQVALLAGMPAVAIMDVDEERHRLKLVGQHNLPGPLVPILEQMRWRPEALEESEILQPTNLFELLLKIKEPIVLPGDRRWTPRPGSPMLKAGLKSGIAAPLRFGDRIYGSLLIGSPEERSPAAGTVRLVESVARRLALFQRNQQLFDSMRGQLAELESLSAVGRLLDEGKGRPESLPEILNEVRDAVRADRVAIYLVEKDRLELAAASGHLQGSDATPVLPYHQRIFETRQSWVVPDAADEDVDPKQRERLEQLGVDAYVAVPLRTPDMPLGVLFVDQFKPRDWTAGEVRLINTFASQISSHLYNWRLLSEAQMRLHELEGVANMSELAALLLDEETLLESALDQFQMLMSAPVVAFYRLMNGRFELFNSRGAIPAMLTMADSSPTLRALLDSRHSLVYDSERRPELDDQLQFFLREYPGVAFVVAPMFNAETHFGLLAVAHAEDHVWSEEEIKTVQTVANEMATAIANSRLVRSLKEQRNNLQMTLNSVFSGVFTTDDNGMIQSWNRAAADISGYSEAQVRGTSWTRELARVGADGPDELVFEAMEEDETVFGCAPRVLRAHGGREIPISEAAAPLKDASGRVRGAVGAFWDRTKERQAEQARLDFLEELSHELRNTLTAILAMAEMLRKPEVKGATRERAISVIAGQVERLKDFSRRFMRFEADQLEQPVEQDVIDVAAMLKDQLEVMRQKYPKQRFDLKGRRAKVYADRRRLETVLVNLLDNSSKFSPPGGHVLAECRLEGDRVRVTVSNDGGSIDPGMQERLLERGFRAPGSENVEGSGIGLWLVQAKLREMDSRIEISSGKERGASFSFSLPRVQAKDETKLKNPTRGRRPRGRTSTRRASRARRV
ncbi:MAG: GAF domain-containing protein [Rudaea sp.]